MMREGLVTCARCRVTVGMVCGPDADEVVAAATEMLLAHQCAPRHAAPADLSKVEDVRAAVAARRQHLADLEAAIERVQALHRIDPWSEHGVVVRCVCEESWPCSTTLALRGE